MADWPPFIARIYDFNSGSWPTDYDNVDEELDQIVDQLNALAAAGVTAELRITEISDDLTAHIADASMHAGGLGNVNGMHWKMVASAPKAKIQVTAASLPTDGGTRLLNYDQTLDMDLTGAGGIDVGPKAPNSWYHVFAIYKSSDETHSILASLSISDPTMPTDYDEKWRLGRCVTDDFGQLHPMVHTPGSNYWLLMDRADANNSESMVMYTSISGLLDGEWVEVDWSALPADDHFAPTATVHNAVTGGAGSAMWRHGSWANPESDSVPMRIFNSGGITSCSQHLKQLLVPIDHLGKFFIRQDSLGTHVGHVALDGWYDNIEVAP